MKRREPLPLFCQKCVNLRQTLLGGEAFCKLECKYNPPYRISAWRSFYKKERSATAA